MKVMTAFKRLPAVASIKLYWQIGQHNRWAPKAEEIAPFQIKDWLFVEQHTKCCVVRARGGSKTFDFTNWIIWRVLRTSEHWCWLTPKSGQLKQAKKYFEYNPFVRQVKNTRSTSFYVYLYDGSEIFCGIISESNLGLRVDGIVFDEFQGLSPKQETEIADQMNPMMTTSKTHKVVYLGTRWIATKFDTLTQEYPTRVTPWDKIPHLVEAGMIQEEINDPAIPEWEKDLLYRCLTTAPGGLLFPTIETMEEVQETIQYGIDFGAKDMCVGVIIDGNDCYVVEEYEFELEADNQVFDFLQDKSVEVESGGYNESKSKLLAKRIGAKRAPVNRKWKSQRQMKARRYTIHCDKNETPNTYKDLKKAQFDEKTGLYLKDNTHPCHYLDAFFHAIHNTTHHVHISQYKTNWEEDRHHKGFGAI